MCIYTHICIYMYIDTRTRSYIYLRIYFLLSTISTDADSARAAPPRFGANRPETFGFQFNASRCHVHVRKAISGSIRVRKGKIAKVRRIYEYALYFYQKEYSCACASGISLRWMSECPESTFCILHTCIYMCVYMYR